MSSLNSEDLLRQVSFSAEVTLVPIARLQSSSCSVARSLSLLGERWTLLVIREALTGTTKFETFREHLGLTPDVLSDRLGTLVENGVMRRSEYREPGSRARYEYFLTQAGQDLHVVIGALQQWGDNNLPHPSAPTVVRRSASSGSPTHVAFVDVEGKEVPLDDVAIVDLEPSMRES